MTTRPQLASSPATAVLTSGELAIESAMRLAAGVARRALDRHLDLVPRALAVPRDLAGEIEQHLGERGPEAVEPGIGGIRDLAGSRAAAAAPVAMRSSVSEVEVSESTVTELKLGSTAADSSACSAVGAIARVGGEEGEHRRHVRRDHAGALGDAVERDGDAVDLDGAAWRAWDRCRWS